MKLFQNNGFFKLSIIMIVALLSESEVLANPEKEGQKVTETVVITDKVSVGDHKVTEVVSASSVVGQGAMPWYVDDVAFKADQADWRAARIKLEIEKEECQKALGQANVKVQELNDNLAKVKSELSDVSGDSASAKAKKIHKDMEAVQARIGRLEAKVSHVAGDSLEAKLDTLLKDSRDLAELRDILSLLETSLPSADNTTIVQRFQTLTNELAEAKIKIAQQEHLLEVTRKAVEFCDARRVGYANIILNNLQQGCYKGSSAVDVVEKSIAFASLDAGKLGEEYNRTFQAARESFARIFERYHQTDMYSLRKDTYEALLRDPYTVNIATRIAWYQHERDSKKADKIKEGEDKGVEITDLHYSEAVKIALWSLGFRSLD